MSPQIREFEILPDTWGRREAQGWYFLFPECFTALSDLTAINYQVSLCVTCPVVLLVAVFGKMCCKCLCLFVCEPHSALVVDVLSLRLSFVVFVSVVECMPLAWSNQSVWHFANDLWHSLIFRLSNSKLPFV